METRRSFLQKSAVAIAALTIPGCSTTAIGNSGRSFEKRNPRRALLLWYSQAGHTKRYGKLIAKVWENRGLEVSVFDIRVYDRRSLSGYDLIVFGSPVFYYDVPVNVKEWIRTMPRIDGTPVASFVSFGGPEGNQHNVAVTLLELLSKKGGIPVGMQIFMNMGTMPTPNWDYPGTLEHRHLPNEATYNGVREYALNVIESVMQGRSIEETRHLGIRECTRIIIPQSLYNLIGYKYLIGKHAIDRNRCIQCHTCIRKCPTGAMNPSAYRVDRHRCIACYGCINNCPSQAIDMERFGRKLYGFSKFLQRNNIKIVEPRELIAS